MAAAQRVFNKGFVDRVAETVGNPTRVLAGTDRGFDTSAGMRRVAGDMV